MFVSSFLFTIFYSSFLVLGGKDIEFSIKVGDNVGLNVDTDKLYFGTVPKGGGVATRDILVKNEKYERAKVNIKAYSDIKKWVYVSENDFFLERGEEKNLNFNVVVPKDADYGEYGGTIRLIFTRF